MSIPNKIVKRLYAKSGNKCAYPGCNNLLLFDEVNQSEMAHIISSKPDGPRHIDNFNNGNYDIEENIMVLCLMHHNIIDTEVEKYPAETLRHMKEMHEKSIAKAVNQKDVNTEFVNQFLTICSKYNVYDLLSEDLVAPFPAKYLDNSTYFNYEAVDLIKSELAVTVDRIILSEIEKFTSALNSLYTEASFYSSPAPNGNGMAVTKFNDTMQKMERREYNVSIIKELISIYNKYRYWSA